MGITHTFRNGETTEISTENFYGEVYASCIVKGKKVFGKPHQPTNKQTIDMLKNAGIAGWWTLGSVNAMIPVSPEEAKAINEMIATEQVALDSTPERQMEILISKRQHLVDDINNARRFAQKQRDRGYDSGDGSGLYVFAGDKYDAEADEISKKLAEFDEQHPEVIAEIKRRRDEEAAKHIWD